MKRRLFSYLLLTFAVLIVCGIGGTSLLTYVSFRQIATRTRIQALDRIEPNIADLLAEYYTSRNDSWRGVDARLRDWLSLQERLPRQAIGYTLFDRSGGVIARGGAAGVNWAAVQPDQGSDVMVGGARVGAIVLVLAGRERVLPVAQSRRAILSEESLDTQIGRVFLLVALGIGGATLGLAVLLSRRISEPLRSLTGAAQRVAAGDLQVRVPGSTIREVDSLAQAFNHMSADLLRADQQRRNITADVAHELRTPLTIIRGRLEGVIDGVYAATPDELGAVLDEVDLLERLIDDLRLLSLAETGQLPLHRGPIVVGELLDDVRRSFSAQAAQQGVTLETAVAPQLPPIDADAQRMQQVLGNLVANSLRYTPGGRITLCAERYAGGVRLAVTDTGSGIAADALPHIFDRFWRADRARSRQGSSTGLGLAIARQLVEAHGGTIEAQSQLGQGTTITIDLPTPFAD